MPAPIIPYTKEESDKLRKKAAHGNGIGLVFARTETAWFIESVWKKADALLFLHGRLSFMDAFPSWTPPAIVRRLTRAHRPVSWPMGPKIATPFNIPAFPALSSLAGGIPDP